MRLHALGMSWGTASQAVFIIPTPATISEKKHENRADKWAIQRLIPLPELDAARADGHTELWELAEYFGVTEDFMRKAVCWYTHGNLATELYF